jgi:hypothetical protein
VRILPKRTAKGVRAFFARQRPLWWALEKCNTQSCGADFAQEHGKGRTAHFFAAKTFVVGLGEMQHTA